MIRMQSVARYSQNNEQDIVLRHIGDRAGFVLDIGAGDGKTFSNSLALIEHGWKALLVEPSPFAFAKLLELHHGNDRVTLLNCTVGTDNRIVKFYESDDSLYSTTRNDQAIKWVLSGRTYRSYFVPQINMSALMTQLGASADVLSIDTEGTSFDILTTCPIGSWDTKAIILEHDGRIVEISGWARDKGYEVCSVNAENVILQRP